MLRTQNRGDVGDANNPTLCSRQVHEATLLVRDDLLQHLAQRFGRGVNVVLMQLLNEQRRTLRAIAVRGAERGNGLHSVEARDAA